MSDLFDSTKNRVKRGLQFARTGASGREREAKGRLAKQEQIAQTELATATDELARKKAGIKGGGRQSLIKSQQGLATNLAGTA